MNNRHFSPARRMAVGALCALALGSQATPSEAHIGPDHQHLDDDSVRVLLLADRPSEPAKLAMLKRLGELRQLVVDVAWLPDNDATTVASSLADYDVVLVDYIWPSQLTTLVGRFENEILKHPGIVFPGLLYRRPEYARGLTTDQARRLFDYYDNGGEENFSRMFQYIRADLMGVSETRAEPPIVLPTTGIYHPDNGREIFANLDSFLTWRNPEAEQPVVGLGFHRKRLEDDLMEPIDQLVRRFEEAGIVAVPYYHPVAGKSTPILYRTDNADAKIPGLDLIVTLRGVMAAPRKRRQELEETGIPVISAMIDNGRTLAEWRDDPQGWGTGRMLPFFTVAEIAGYIDPIILGAQSETGEPELIPEQVDALVERIQRYVRLQKTPNNDKRVAFVVWNAPEGEDNFAASYLNVPASLVNMFAAMRDAGYQIPDITETEITENLKRLIKPYYRTNGDFSLRSLINDDLAARMPLDSYRKWFGSLPPSVREATLDTWGDPGDDYLTVRSGERADYAIPRLILGNIVLLPQPLRGDRRDFEAEIFHDKNHPAHHAYRAVYKHLVHELDVDAIVHVGTHGTQEWLAGKERAPWAFEDTQTTIGNTPIIYPYNVANVGEAMIAKRRGRAVVVSHNAPAFAPSGLYGELVEVHEYMHQLEQMEDGLARDKTREELVALVTRLGFDKDIEYTPEQIQSDWNGFIDALHDYMESISTDTQPLGLHTFGEVADPDHILLTILQVMGPDYMAAADPRNGRHVLDQDFEAIQQSTAFTHLKAYLREGVDLNFFAPELHQDLKAAREIWDGYHGQQEIDHLLAALEARYVPAGTGNDPLRNAEALPTGKNIFAFNPNKIPTKAAWSAGVALAENLLTEYVANNGVYPDKLTFSMWSSETLEHFGVVEAQILHLLGVRPLWNRMGNVVGVEVVPARELGRPRTDIVMSITGLYRDNLPEVMSILQQAINAVATLDEDNNYVRKHVLELQASLLDSGMNRQEAEAFSQLRIFGNESGVYGSNVSEGALASGEWEDDSALAETWLTRMGYAYGLEEGMRSKKLSRIDLFAENLRGTKAAILSRSSNSYGVMSTDHPFEYLGGISLAVRHLTGESPELMIADLRKRDRFATVSASTFLAQEIRSRYYHPRYVSEMQAEGFSGAVELLDAVNNLWGWNVMDRKMVRDDQWQEMFDIYVQDKLDLGLEEFFRETHPAALAQIAERMLEAVRKEYWDAPQEVVRELVETYMELMAEFDIDTNNDKFKEFLEVQAAGFGLEVPQAMADAIEQAGLSELVEGMKLEQVPIKQLEVVIRWWLYLLLAVLVLAGAGWERFRQRTSTASTRI